MWTRGIRGLAALGVLFALACVFSGLTASRADDDFSSALTGVPFPLTFAGWLRKQGAPEDLIRFWLGHANKSVTDDYSKVKEDVAFRKKVTEQVGIGFELSAQAPVPQTEVAPNCTQSELLARTT